MSRTPHRPAASSPSLTSGTWTVPESLAGAPLDRALRTLVGGASWNVVRRCIASGKVCLDGERVIAPTAQVASQQTIELKLHAPRVKESRLGPHAMVHLDSQLVVVEKPAGIATVPFEDSDRSTLDVLVAAQVSRGGRARPLHVVHRLDKETSGLLVFARTPGALRALKGQFRVHSVARRYLALVHGEARSGTIRSRLVVDRGDGRRGSTSHRGLGREAVTHVQAIQHLSGATLVACRLETGRTHQIRIHLAEAGHPLLGERVYSKGYLGALLPAPRILLHAAELGFSHPTTGEHVLYRSEPPPDFVEALERLRGG